jgi:hypothetical protein
MISVVYLVLYFYSSGYGFSSTEQIPQANVKQCEINKEAMRKQGVTAYCIVGVK